MTDGRTHYDECWRTRGHQDCAIAEVERLWAALERIGDETHNIALSEGALLAHIRSIAREALRGAADLRTEPL